MKRYVRGRYFSSDEEMEVLKNPPNRLIVDKLSEVYPARRTAKQLENDFTEKSNIVKSTIHGKLIDLRKNFFIYELKKQQDLELKNRRMLVPPPQKEESSISAKYVLEDVSNSLYRVLPYHLAPGYCHYTEEFQVAWNYLAQMIEKELVENLRTSILRLINNIINIVESSRIEEISRIVPTGMFSGSKKLGLTGPENFLCANCGIDHESRNFIRAIFLHLLDDFELSNDFIKFLQEQKIVNENGLKLYRIAQEEFIRKMKLAEAQVHFDNQELVDEWFEKLSPTSKMYVEKIMTSKPEMTKAHLYQLTNEKKRKGGTGYTDAVALFRIGESDLGICLH